MPERNLDFDRIIDRHNTNSIKYDRIREKGMPDNVLPFWVADMEFQVSSYVQDALKERVQHGIFGYSEVGEDYYQAVHDWMLQRHGWETHRDWLVKTPGVVFALAMAVKAFTREGDPVLIQRPVYYPFTEVIEDNNRRVVNSPLRLTPDGSYEMDFADLEEKIRSEKVRLMLLCNPHNPVGRAWTRQELEQLGELCLAYDVLVISDEIHADFVFHGTHQVFADLSEDLARNCVVCTAPSKTFNLAGLQISNLWIPNPLLREKFRHQLDAAGYSQHNALGLVAAQAAYQYGGEWYEAMIGYVKGNIVFLKEYIAKHMPQIRVTDPQATYLIWLDMRALGLTSQELSKRMTEKAGLWLDDGPLFGPEGEGFERINVACPRSMLQEALERMERIL